jgi:hypothetical protein
MRTFAHGRVACAALAMTALAGCNTWCDRHGPPPVLNAASVAASTANREALMDWA